jgi:hypothetical protein
MTRIAVPLFVSLAALPLASALAETAPFGRPPGATIAVQKLAPIDGFVNGEIAAGTIPGASTTLISAMATRRTGSASTSSCCSTTASSWPACS